jgi:GT2 family glycosyltransferase
MQDAHRLGSTDVVGVGAFIEHGSSEMTWLMRQRLLCGVIPDRQPGKYHPSGVSIGWALAKPSDERCDTDWIPGGVAMWKTAIARDEGFCEAFQGYSPGEDLEFSLRMSKRGRLVMACAARVEHHHEGTGRPNHFVHGYMGIYNLYKIHRQEYAGRYLCWFVYTWTLDTVFLMRHFFFPTRAVGSFQHILGRLGAAFDILFRRQPA